MDSPIIFAIALLAASIIIPVSDAKSDTTYDLGLYTCQPLGPGEGNMCTTVPDYSNMTYISGKTYAYGGGHAATYRDDVELFDFGSRSWLRPYPPTPCVDLNFGNLDAVKGRWISTNHPVARHTFDLQVAVGDKIVMMAMVQGRGRGCNNLTPTSEGAPYVISDSTIAVYNTLDGTWQFTDIPSFDHRWAAELDPVSGNILIVGQTGLWTFNPQTLVLTQHKKWSISGMLGIQHAMVYSQIDDTFYIMTDAGGTGFVRNVLKVNLDRQTLSNTTVENLNILITADRSAAGWAYDSRRALIVGGITNGVLHEFNPVTRTFNQRQLVSDTGIAVGTLHWYAITYSPEFDALMFRTKTGASNTSRTFMYKAD